MKYCILWYMSGNGLDTDAYIKLAKSRIDSENAKIPREKMRYLLEIPCEKVCCLKRGFVGMLPGAAGAVYGGI